VSILDRPGESCRLSIEYSYSILLAVLETIKVSVNLVSNNTMRAAVVRLSAAAPDFFRLTTWSVSPKPFVQFEGESSIKLT